MFHHPYVLLSKMTLLDFLIKFDVFPSQKKKKVSMLYTTTCENVLDIDTKNEYERTQRENV